MAYKVSLYLDEHSVEKIESNVSLVEYLLSFIHSFNKLREGNAEVNIVRCSTYQNSLIYSSKSLLQELSESVPSDLRLRFKKIIFDKKNSIWDNNRIHSSEEYYEFIDACVTDGTIAEASERKLNEMKGVMVFLYPFLALGDEIQVTKEETVTIDVARLSSSFDIANWLDREFDISELDYDYGSQISPTDRQTYLRESTKFIKTEKINQGRIVYQCALTRRYHSVDNLHHGLKSHVEVWDRHGTYLGEANLTGLLNTDIPKEKKGKKHNPPWL
ncbi:hypothetical protein QJ367_001416 [Vibrio vulnificus]|nr:hypothetical protein [Vibrio vulnificus]ELX4206856.1 hypothetical protein [Vibrio vulnificus]